MKKRRRKYIIMGSLLLVTLLCLVLVLSMQEARGLWEQFFSLQDQISTENLLADLDEIGPGTVLEESRLDPVDQKRYFTSCELTEEQKEDMKGKSYIDNPLVSLDDLRYVKVLHYNYDHKIQVGELVVNQAIAEDCTDIFYELFLEEYEICSMYRMDRYFFSVEGTLRDPSLADINSINNNNTSAYSYRVVEGTDVLSEHAKGMAIDINPLQNPYVVKYEDGTSSVGNAYQAYETYKDRGQLRDHMICKGDVCYEIFAKYGFSWGGDWEGTKDYQHFEKMQ